VLGLRGGVGGGAWPGVGASRAAGPAWAALGGAPSAPATGGLVGGLIGLGIPEIEAKRYEDKLKKGNYLICAHAKDGKQIDHAEKVFKDAGAEDICTVSEATAPAH
jgi:hypothetical protein